METLVIPIIPHDGVVKGPPQGQWTRAAWEKLDHTDKRYEVIEGVLYLALLPSYFHQYVSRRFIDLVGIPGDQWAYVSFGVGVMMAMCEPVVPDLTVVMRHRSAIIHDRYVHGVPDLIGEVLSPNTKAYDEGVKRNAYERCGVPEYIVIDPAARQLRLYTLNTSGQYGQPVTYNAQDTVSFACLPTISFLVGDLFDGAADTTL